MTTAEIEKQILDLLDINSLCSFENSQYVQLTYTKEGFNTAIKEIASLIEQQQPTDIDKKWIFEIMDKTNAFAKQLIEDHFKRHEL
jgi:hypothetical protein